MAKNKKKKSKQEVEKNYGTGIAPVSNKFTLNTQSNKKTSTKKSTKKKESTKKVETTKKDTVKDTKTIAPVEVKGNDKFTIQTPEIQRTEEQEKVYNEKVKKAGKIGAFGAKKTFSGTARTLVGLAEAPLQNMQEGAEQGKGSSRLKNIGKGYLKSIDLFGLTSIPENARDLANIAYDPNLNVGQKILQSGLAVINNNPVVQSLEGTGRLIKGIDKNADKHIEKARDTINKPLDEFSESLAEESKQYGKVVNTVANAGEVVGAMLPSIAASAITGGAGGSAAAQEAISLAIMGVGAKGTATREAEKKGATLSQANDIGFAKGLTEVLTEKLYGGLGKLFGKGAVDDFAKGLVNDYIKNKGLNFVAKKGLDIVGEIVEEHISDIVDFVIDKNTTDPDAKYSFKDWLNTGLMTTLSTIMLNLLTGGYASGAIIENSTELEKSNQTDNVQKIIESELEERINDEYKGKATAREIANLQKEIIEDINNGYISTEKIERTLGGETYNQLNELNKQQANIQNQINELERKAERNELESLEEKQKLEDLKKQIKEIDNTELKNKLTNEVNEIIKNDKGLQESYLENNRRKENFFVDLNTIQDETQRSVYQKAMDSGVLNNSNKTHALVDMIAKICADKNIDFDFTNNSKLENSGFGLQGNVFEVRDSNGNLVQEFKTEEEARNFVKNQNNSNKYSIENVYKTINGYETDSGITINLNSHKAINRIVGHELTHTFEGTTLYKELQESLKEFVGETRWNNLVNEYESKYKDVKNANATNELTSDLIGDYLFTDENFVRDLSVKHRNLFEKIYDEIKYLYNVATAGSSEKRMIAKVKKIFDKMYNTTESKTTSDTKLDQEVAKNDEIEYNKDGIYINDKEEYGSLRNTVTYLQSQNLLNKKGTDVLENGNYFYIIKSSGFSDFTPIIRVRIEGNESLIDNIKGEYKNGINTNSKTFDNIIKSIEDERNTSDRDNVSLEKGTTTKPNDRLYNREQGQDNRTTGIQQDGGIDRELDNSSLFDDKKFSISRETGKLQENGNDVILETSDTGNTGTLMAIHNLSEDKLKGILELGGFPVPSIAITNPNIIDHNGYGNISVLFDKSTIDPAVKENEVYDRDVWSPKFPQVNREIIDKNIDKAAPKIGMSDSSLQSLAEDYNNVDDLAYRLSRDADVVEKYLNDNKIKYDNDTNIYNLAKDNGIVEFLTDQLKDVYGEKGIYNQKSYLTDSGNRRTFWQLHDKYNLENIVKQIIKQKTVGSHVDFTGEGFGNLQARMTNKFKSIEDIKKNESKIMNKADADAVVGALADRLNDSMIKLSKLYGDKFDAFWDMDSINYQLQELSRAKNVSVDEYYRIANKYNPTLAKADRKTVQDIVDTMNELKNIPTDYFEAKPQRAVGLDEVQQLVIPNNTSTEFKKQLQDAGLKYTEYDPNIEGDRQRVINQFDDIKFDITRDNGINENEQFMLSQDSQGSELTTQQQDYFKYSQARDENGNLEVVYHGSNSAGFTVFNRNYNYYTNNKNVSKTYTGSNEMVDTRKLESTYDAKSWLKNIISDAYIEGNKVYINGEEVLSYNSSEDLFKNLKRDIQEEFGDTKAGGIYEGYVNITNPLIVNCNGNKWSAIDISGIEGNLDSLFEEYGASTFEEDGATRTSTSDIASAVSDAVDEGALDYDGIIFKNIVDEGMYSNGTESGTVSNVYVTFNSNQFKAKDNLEPTKNRDIRYSLDRIPISKNLLTQAEQDELDGLKAVDNSGFAELTPEESKRMYELENRANTVLNKKAEKMLRSASYKAINTATKAAQSYLDFDANEKKSFRNQIREFSNMTKDELVSAETYNKVKDLVSQYANKEVTYVDDSIDGIKREIKHTKIKISDELKNQITDYGDFVKDSKLMLRRNSGQNVDSVYKEYSEMYPGFFDSDVWNEADQLEALNNFVNNDFSVTEKFRIPDSELKNATDIIYNKLLDNSLSMQDLIETEEILDKKAQIKTRTQVREELLDKMFNGYDLNNLIQAGNDISAIDFARTDPIRVNEKVFGWKVGQIINDATVNFTKHQEAEGIRFLKQYRQQVKDLGLKARSKESELAQKYGEKQYVDKDNVVHEYGDAELNRDVKDVATRNKIKNAAKVIRNIYDETLDRINSSLTEMGYDPIPKRKDYMMHFIELEDKFSRWGLPFNKETMMSEDLPTDINGLTEFNRPGKSYFASANTRTGLQTTYDAITGIDKYLEGAKNLIYHTESIQRYRALTRFIRENYGREHGLDNIDLMTDEELADRIKDIQDNKLSKYVAWLDEQANAIAGKKGSLDRSIERLFGRRVYTAFNTLKSQVGSNMTGFNPRSALTNFASMIQGASKTQKVSFAEGTVSTINNIIHDDGMIDKSDFLTRRFGSNSLSMKPWQKLSKAGQIFMEGTDYFTANVIWRSKYFENLHKGMSEEQAIKNADDFAARIMGDRSKGSTAELFNSKTLGFLSQFQLEVNNQWSSLIHDNKIDIQSGNKTALGVTFELGQLFAASYLFNTMMKALTGSDVMIDPIDMLLKIFKKDDDDDSTIVERAQKVLGEFINQLPFANLVTGGGRIPISEAFTGASTLGKKLMGGTDNYGNEITWEDVGEDFKDSLAYWVLPTGYGQIRKTVKGLSMYDDKLPIAGSYTKSGNLRFSAEDTTFGKIKAGLFGQYSSKYAQDYIDSGYKSINSSKLDEMKDLDMNSTEYREYRQGLSNAGSSVEDKLNYISDLDVSDEEKTIMASNVAKKDIDMSEYKKYGSYDEFNYAQKNPAKYEVMKLIGGYDTYKNYEKEIESITADYGRNGKAITNSRKNKVIKYVNSLNLTKAQKAMLIKEQYPSFTQYDSEIASYVNNQNMSFIEKAGILKQLGFKTYDKQIINYIKQNYRTVEEQQKELEKLGFKIYNYNGQTYVR